MPEDQKISTKSEISINVKSPDGQSLAIERKNFGELDPNKPIAIKVEPAEFFPVESNTDPSFTKPQRLRGLVVDSTGQGNISNKQVVLWGTPKQPSNAQSEIVGSTRTDAQGYFSIDFPLGSFSNAEGTVNGSVRVPIRLNEDGSFPERVVLGAEIPKEEKEGVQKQECDCKSENVPRNPDSEDLVSSSAYTSDIGGRCVDITKPNRVLEEFDYYTVVRTTEPIIKGITIKEPPKINLADIVKIMTPALVLKKTERSTTPSRTVNPSRGDPPSDVTSSTIGSVNFAGREIIPTIDIDTDNETLKKVNLDTNITKMLAHDPDGFTLTRFASAEFLTNKTNLIRVVDILKHLVPGRGTLSCNNPADWDDEPTFYQACTIAHGHILHFKQEWVADGYSFGDLLYSLPLAPCQKKQLAVLDWDRRESATRRESLEEQEFLSAQLQRDRDISEMANAMVRESMSGGSSAKTGSFGGGLGIGAILGPVGGLLGIGGGTSKASSKAWQKSSRSTSANSLQQLRDSVMQASSAVRNQRSTVIQTVRQGESFRVETEVVANHNHCHAITMEYFEVLRHFLVKQRLADVQECLLIPFLMTRFDSAKALRWRESLTRSLRNRRLQRGFDALQRIADNYVGSNMPVGSYADENLEYLDGFLRMTFRIQRPRDDNEGNFVEGPWNILSWLGISPLEFWERHLKDQQNRDDIFAQILGPRIAEEIVNGLRVFAVLDNDTELQLPIDPTLVSDFHNDRQLYVSLRLDDELPSVQRKRIKFIKIGTIVDTNAGPKNIDDILPEGSKILVNSGQMRYRTAHISYNLFNQSRIQNDLSGTDGVLIFTPLNWRELRRPRDEDKEFANSLIKHLNDHLEYYHRVIWWLMDPQRRYMLLDGFIAPNSGGKSVASVVENNLVGIIGNCLVLPVSSGSHLDPTFKQNEEEPIDLLEHYQPTTPIAPARIAVPTKGVFAESVMGACNSCEKKDDSRFWRFEESPCSDVPTQIQPISTESRRSTPPDLTAKDFPSPIVAFQNVPQAPDPQGFGSLLQLLSNPNLFRDITGLTENQRNALKALQSALGTAQFFGGKAADLALQGAMNRDVDKALDKINEQHQSGAINDQQRSQLTEAALRSMIGGGTEAPRPISADQVEQLANTAGTNDASISVNRPGGESIQVDAKPTTASLRQPLQERCGFFGPNSVTSERDLRDAIRISTETERNNWIDTAGNLLEEDENSQFGLLASYWLGASGAIRPNTLTTLRLNAINPATAYGQLLNDAASNAAVSAEAANVRAQLLVGAPGGLNPANLHNLIEQDLLSARFSRQDHPTRGPWSAVFVTSCVRNAAIQLGVEGMSGSTHVGRDGLLVGTSAHRVYVLEAHRKRFGPNQGKGTYHAFRPNERVPQVGDIIIQDRQVNDINNVLDFNDIPARLTGGYALHGDIVVEVPDGADHVVTIGGNVSNSVRRRRYPLDTNRHLVVDRVQLYTQEDDSANLPNLPDTDNSAGLNPRSTGRIFALLSLVEECAVVPGQRVDSDTVLV